MKKNLLHLSIFVFAVFQSISILHAYEKNLAILIGVTRYDSENFEDDRGALRVGNDVEAIAQRLAEGGNQAFEIVALTGDSANLATIQQTLQEKLAPANCQYRHTVLVYFSGHGTVSSLDNERVLLAVKDSGGEESSFLCANDIRESLSQCGAEKCLFLLDACHSGGVKNKPKPIIRDTKIPGVITLASCRNDESSGTWIEKNMSNFSYWLNEALKGYADSDRNGFIDTEELGNYIAVNLGYKTKLQHPVVVKHPQTEHFPVFKPRSRQLYAVLDDVAEQVILYASLKNIQSFYSQGFQVVSKVGTFRSSDFDSNDFNDLKKVSSFCTSELQRRIHLKSHRELTVSPDADRNGPSLRCEIHRNDKRYFLTLTCKLSGADETSGAKTDAESITISQQILIRAAYETPAPQTMAPGYVPCRIFLEVKTPHGYEPRAMERIRGQYYVALDAGEVYRVVVHRFRQPDTHPRRLGLKLFVDGCSTLPQTLSEVGASKFQIAGEAQEVMASRGNSDVDTSVFSSGAPMNASHSGSGAGRAILSIAEEVEAPNVPLDAAKFYFLCGQNADAPYNFDAVHRFHGFLKTIGDVASYREFLVAPGNESVGSGENIGLITAAFYELVDVSSEYRPNTRGTVEGGWGTTRAPAVNGISTGALLQKVTIRYVPQKELEMYRQGVIREETAWAE